MSPDAVVRLARQHSGLSLRALARRAGTSHATLSAYEHGRVVPGVDTLARVVQAAGLRWRARLVPALDLTGRAEELWDALELAGMFPAEPTQLLCCPPFGRSAGPAAGAARTRSSTAALQ